jgi:hypothetical protein
MVSTDFNGTDVINATWTELNYSDKPEGSGWDFVETEKIDLNNYVGKSINLAFRYRSTTSGAATWEIDWVSVQTEDVPKPEYTYYNEFFEKTGGQWALVTNDNFGDQKYIVSEDDYAAMGNPGPGEHNYFSSSIDPEDYLPLLIAQKLPYHQEDTVAVIYKYNSSGSTTPNASEYVFNGTTWQNTARIIERTEQFVHNGTEWIFDPAVTFTMTSSDYQIIVDYVKSNYENGSSYINSYGTAEYYFGADSYSSHTNFDLRVSNRDKYKVPGFEGLSEDDAIALMFDRLGEAVNILLREKYPDAVPQMNGADVYYNVTINTYENDLSHGEYTFKYQCISSAPEFKLVEAPKF